jgi:ComF family protein
VTPPIPNPPSLIPIAIPSFPRIVNALVTALLAPACAVCDAVLDEPLSGCVCRTCWRAVRPITPPVCDSCGDPLANRHQSPIPGPKSLGVLCRPCCGRERIIERARAVGEYEGTLRELIHALKYGRRRSMAASLAAQMRSRGAPLLDTADGVVPVPLHWRREYRRGFNQARELARHLGLPLIDVLIRMRHTRPQVELAASHRRANVEGAFALRRRVLGKSQSLEGLTLVLVDDVSTTGATLEECARVLKHAGASRVYALTAARVVTRPRSRRVERYA